METKAQAKYIDRLESQVIIPSIKGRKVEEALSCCTMPEKGPHPKKSCTRPCPTPAKQVDIDT
jgi:hypothetical protein